MTLFEKLIPDDEIRDFYMVIDFYENYIIVENEWGDLFYFEGDVSNFEYGILVENNSLNPIHELDISIVNEIYEKLGKELN